MRYLLHYLDNLVVEEEQQIMTYKEEKSGHTKVVKKG